MFMCWYKRQELFYDLALNLSIHKFKIVKKSS